MGDCDRRIVKRLLRRLGLRPARGKGDGHEVWRTMDGRSCRPVFRHGAVHRRHLECLAIQLANVGIVKDKSTFLRMLNTEAGRSQPCK